MVYEMMKNVELHDIINMLGITKICILALEIT
jgi:hypothetical protein